MEVIIFLHLGLAYWLYRYFMNHDRGAKEPRSALRITIIFGVGAGMVAGALNTLLLPEGLLNFLDDKGPMPSADTLLLGALTVGVIEELVKFLPLVLWIYPKKYFNETTDGIIYFGLCGMWFGAIESIEYAFMYGEGVGITRLIIGPFLHAGFTALAGWGLARMKIRGQWWAVVILLSLAITIHGLYDYFLFTGLTFLWVISLLVAFAVNVSVFVLFKKAQQADEAYGLSASGVNKFCRHCGASNYDRNLFCTVCGKKA